MMSKFNDLLNLRFKHKPAQPPKMTALVERSNNGDLSSFAGIFRVSALTDPEKEAIASILHSYRSSDACDVHADLDSLSVLTSEVKAISNQAAILHGERIKRAQEILKKYRDGAFTAWLYAVYGNRQTPYNFLQYYEFHAMMPAALHSTIDQMPRQAIYSLASREGSAERKAEIVKNYRGQTKQELLNLIRVEFPLREEDRRTASSAFHAIQLLKRVRDALTNPLCGPSREEKKLLRRLLAQIQKQMDARDA